MGRKGVGKGGKMNFEGFLHVAVAQEPNLQPRCASWLIKKTIYRESKMVWLRYPVFKDFEHRRECGL